MNFLAFRDSFLSSSHGVSCQFVHRLETQHEAGYGSEFGSISIISIEIRDGLVSKKITGIFIYIYTYIYHSIYLSKA